MEYVNLLRHQIERLNDTHQRRYVQQIDHPARRRVQTWPLAPAHILVGHAPSHYLQLAWIDNITLCHPDHLIKFDLGVGPML